MQPSDYGLPHGEFRPHQEGAIQWALDQKTHAIMEAPTGSGKTSIAAALASQARVVSLVRTKFLQEDNYERGYEFKPLYGRANYPCVYEKAKAGAMADECAFSEEGMHKCPQAGDCLYIRNRELAKVSNKAALNYAYWFHSHSKWPAPGILVCDEAHQLPDLTLEWAGCTVTEKTRQEFDLPFFPMIRSGAQKGLYTAARANPRDLAISWLSEARNSLVKAAEISKFRDDPEARKKARRIETLGKKIRATLDAMEAVEEGWFIRSGPSALGEGEWGFTAKPLTARYHFQHYFTRGDDWRLLVMSATIGNLETFASELGLEGYASLRIPNAWDAKTRPVYALDVPRLGYKSSNADWEKQADEIATAIKRCDPAWSGMVHVTSIKEAGNLSARLAKRGLQDRIYLPRKAPTQIMVQEWHRHLKRVPNAIMVSWAMWEGYDGTQEKINIVAKTPYPFLGDPYEIERRSFDGKFFLQRAAWQMEQGLGRTRRGKVGDYDTSDTQNGFVAIADGGYKWVRNYFSQSFGESLIDVRAAQVA